MHNNNSAYKNQCDSWPNNNDTVTVALLQQHQQQQHVQSQQLLQGQQIQEQHHQARISNWISDTNRSHYSLLHNNSSAQLNCAQQRQQQQPLQLPTTYLNEHTYGNYAQPVATTNSPHHQQQQPPPQITDTAVSANNCYYRSRMQQHQELNGQSLPYLEQSECQQSLAQKQLTTPLHAPFSAATKESLSPQPRSQSPGLTPSNTTTRTFQQRLAVAAAAVAAARNVNQQHQRLVSVDGIQSGVPTLTTSTLTPTTLRSIEETFIQLTADHSNPPCQAGFIPPPVTSIQNSTSPIFSGAIQNYNEIDMDDSQASWNSQLHDDNSQATTDNSSASFPNGLNGTSNASLATSTTSSKNDFTMLHNAIGSDTGKHAGNLLLTNSPNSSNVHTSSSATNTTITATPTRRNQGGRRPAKPTNMSPEEEEKRRIRRERNKLAAARCRKRRVDQTNELQTEVDRLENIRESLTKEIENLKVTKNQLAFILEAHRPTCQKVRQDLLSVHTYDGLIAPTNGNSNDSNSNIIGVDTTLSSVGRSGSPIDLKPVILDMVSHIKNEPLDNTLDSNSSLGHDGPPSPKRMLLSDNNPMVQPPLPNVSTLSASLAAASASLNTPIVTAAPVSFASLVSGNSISNNNNNNIVNSIAISNAITGTLSAPHRPILSGSKQRPNSLPTNLRNQAQNLALNTERPPTDINGVAIQTPSTGMFNFDSLMDGGTGLTPVSGPLVPNCSTQNKHPLEIQTPTSEPSKLVSL
ncbi:transcription factor kayak isoform X2 [Bactrocera neohumeralis]|uniref:transcription factor kayak isoform X2 n=1 Tax=Bactrocera neohumeralis TaxID=98809 RepID=UPI00216606CD|nr:transcription factor kayak isoform X2 [Bactrocera neohumeralis]